MSRKKAVWAIIETKRPRRRWPPPELESGQLLGVIMQSTRLIVLRRFLLICACTIAPIASWANDIAQFRVARGSVYLERSGQRLPARVGTRLQATDIVVTGADGSAG